MKKISILSILIIVFFCGMPIQAQSVLFQQLSSQFKYTVNPASIRIGEGVGFNLNYTGNHNYTINTMHKVGIGVEGGFIGNNMGIGLVVGTDIQNVWYRTTTQLQYAYRAHFANDHYITLGLSVGFSNEGVNISKVNEIEGFDMSDITLQDNKTNACFGFGVNYRIKSFVFNFSIPAYALLNKANVPLYVSAEYSFDLNNKFELKPEIMYNAITPSQHFGDIRLQAKYDDKYWMELGYRTQNELLIGVGGEYANVQLGYMYGVCFGKLAHTNRGQHEVVLAYRIPKAVVDMNNTRAKRNERALTSISDNVEHIKTSENNNSEVLKKMVDEITHEFKSDIGNLHTDIISLRKNDVMDTVEINKVLTTKYYIVVFSTTSIDDAQRIVARMARQGEHGQILSHSDKKHFFIYTEVKDNMEDASVVMQKERERGYKDAWILILK